MPMKTATKKTKEVVIELSDKVVPGKVKVGDIMAFTYYGKVNRKVLDLLEVTNIDTNTDFHVRGNELISLSKSADQYNTEQEVTKMRAAEILVNSYNVPMTVSFTKANGENRVMRCRLVQPEHLLGRSHVEDLDLPSETSRLRQIDHRTIEYLIVNNIKYTVK